MSILPPYYKIQYIFVYVSQLLVSISTFFYRVVLPSNMLKLQKIYFLLNLIMLILPS
jgi:hypothetical protein